MNKRREEFARLLACASLAKGRDLSWDEKSVAFWFYYAGLDDGAAIGDPDWRPTEANGGHRWGYWKDMKYESCRICGYIRRADDKNKACDGPKRIELR